MSLATLDAKTILMGISASLTGYIFYGFIELSALVETMRTEMEQVKGEQVDLWGKYNDDQKTKFDFAVKFYEYKLEQENTWKEYYKNEIK
jgi:hypothetical protein